MSYTVYIVAFLLGVGTHYAITYFGKKQSQKDREGLTPSPNPSPVNPPSNAQKDCEGLTRIFNTLNQSHTSSISQMDRDIRTMEGLTRIFDALTPNPSPVDPPVLDLAAHKKTPSATKSTD